MVLKIVINVITEPHIKVGLRNSFAKNKRAKAVVNILFKEMFRVITNTLSILFKLNQFYLTKMENDLNED